MKRLIYSFVFSFIGLFLIWTIIAYVKYPDDFYEKHIDLYSIVNEFSKVEIISIGDLYDELTELKEFADLTLDPNDEIIPTIMLVFAPIVYTFRLVADLIEFILLIFKFIFNPIFI